MLVSPDHLLTAAQERFAAHDYYGTVHHLEELVEAGHAYADAHHLMCVALAMLGRADAALAAFERALALNPRYVEALVHRGPRLHLCVRHRGRHHRLHAAGVWL